MHEADKNRRSWRLVVDGALSGSENMAIDEAIVRSYHSGATQPCLRFYGWKSPTLTIGYRQNPAGEAARILSPGRPGPGTLEIIRRITGGRAVLHHMELTYSIVCGRGVRLFDGGIHGSYAVVSGAIVDALSDAGIDAEFSPADRAKRGPRGGSCFSAATRYEVLVDGKKLAGSAQRRFNDVFLLQGTVLFDVDAPLNEAVFGRGAAGNMAWINALSPLGVDAFRELLIARLEVALNARFFKTGLSAEETRLKQGLVTSRYSSDEWNLHGRSDDKPVQTNGPRTIQGPARGVEA